MCCDMFDQWWANLWKFHCTVIVLCCSERCCACMVVLYCPRCCLGSTAIVSDIVISQVLLPESSMDLLLMGVNGKIVIVPYEGRRERLDWHCRCHHCIHGCTAIVVSIVFTVILSICSISKAMIQQKIHNYVFLSLYNDWRIEINTLSWCICTNE